MIEAAYAAYREADGRVAGWVEDLPGGYRLHTPDFPSSWDLNALVLAPGADQAAVRAAAADAGPRITVWAPAGAITVAGRGAEELVAMAFDGPPPTMPDGVSVVAPSVLLEPRRALWQERVPGERGEQLLDMQQRQAESSTLVAVVEDGEPLAWACTVGTVVDDVWVQEHARGRGLGRAVTLGAMAAGGNALLRDADDPIAARLYGSLGWVDAGSVIQLTLG